MTRRAWVLFAVVAVLWGSPFVLIKVAVDAGVAAPVIAASRVALGALVLLPVALASGSGVSPRRRWRPLLAVAVLDIAMPFLLVPLAERSVSSGLAGILIATTPLFVGLLGVRFDPTERTRPPQFAGLGLGFAGVVLIGAAGSHGSWAGIAGLLAAAVAYATATLIIRRCLSDVPAVSVSVTALVLSTAILAVPAGLTFDPDTLTAPAFGVLAVLGVMCTGLAFWAFYALIGLVGATRAAVSIYLTPAVAVVLGITLLDEELTVTTTAGLVLVFAGSWISTRTGPIRDESTASPSPSRR